MSEMLKSIKADLTSRQMLPILIVVSLALVAAIAYGVLGGSSGASPSSSVAAAPVSVPPVPGPSVSSAPADPNAALAETTAGASFQHTGRMRDPFAPLPGSQSAEAQTGSGSGSGGGQIIITHENGSVTSTTGTVSGPEGSSVPPESASPPSPSASNAESPTAPAGASTPAASAPAPAATTVTVYRVSATLQQLSGKGRPVGRPQSFKDIQTLTPLPGRGDPLMTPYLAGKGGKSMIFLLLRAPILQGSATCLPSAEDCLGIEVALHHSEQLRYLSSNGTVTAYRLTVTAISPRTITLSAEKAREAQRKGLAIIKRRAARLTKALAGNNGKPSHG